MKYKDNLKYWRVTLIDKDNVKHKFNIIAYSFEDVYNKVSLYLSGTDKRTSTKGYKINLSFSEVQCIYIKFITDL